MKIRWYTPFKLDGPVPDPEWPENWPVPSVGASIVVLGGDMMYVRGVDYYPQGEEDDSEPFVYIVLSSSPQ